MNNFTPSTHGQNNSKKLKMHRLLKVDENLEDLQSPSRKAVNNILAYSKSLELKVSKHLDFIDHVLN